MAEKTPGMGQGIAGMIVAIHGLALSWVPFLGLIICIIGLVLSIIAKRKGGKGQAKAGVICSIIGLCIQVFFILVPVLVSLIVGTREIAIRTY